MSNGMTEEEARSVAREALEACWVACQMARFDEGGSDPWLFRVLHRVTGGALSGWHRDGRARLDAHGHIPILDMDDGGVIWLAGAQEPQPREVGEAAVAEVLRAASRAKAQEGEDE